MAPSLILCCLVVGVEDGVGVAVGYGDDGTGECVGVDGEGERSKQWEQQNSGVHFPPHTTSHSPTPGTMPAARRHHNQRANAGETQARPDRTSVQPQFPSASDSQLEAQLIEPCQQPRQLFQLLLQVFDRIVHFPLIE